MKPMQYDIERHSPARMANAYRVAAETAESNPFLPPHLREQHATYYREQAAKFEPSPKKEQQ